MPIATYPGTVTPLRGLGSFAESERDVFFGRDAERDQLATLVTDTGYRAGLLYGETGVGRTSFLRAGLQPSLRDHGIVALFCQDNNHPLDSFAQALSQASGQVAKESESATNYLARVIGQAAQMYLFLLDDIDLAMSRDERVCAEVAELFTRIASRSAGRARFLFSCASDRVHAFAALELRTGSLFPPASRFELCRMAIPEATLVLERTIALAGIPCQEDLAPAVIADLSAARSGHLSGALPSGALPSGALPSGALPSGALLPSDLQIAAIAIKEQSIANAAQFQQLGGYAELEKRWVLQATQATGNERSAMRLLAVLAQAAPMQPCPASSIASQANVDLAFTQHGLTTLQSRGLVQGNPVHGSEELHYALRHEVLVPRLMQQAAPAAISAKRASDILGSKAAQDKGLSRREYRQLQREGIVPSTPQEQAVIAKTVRRTKLILAAAAALPLLVIIFVYISMSGSYYLDTAQGAEGAETIVVRAGKPGLSWFHWLPKDPSFGSIVADTGLTKRMVSESVWQQVKSHDLGGDLSDEGYVKQVRSARRPELAALVQFSQSGDASTFASVQKHLKSADEFARFLETLRPIAMGTPEELSLVQMALGDTSSAVQAASLSVAVAAESRHPGTYTDLLANVLASADPQRRQLAISALRDHPSSVSTPILQAALALGPEEEAGQELRALIPSELGEEIEKELASTVLGAKTLSDSATAEGQNAMLRSFRRDPRAATPDAILLVTNETANAAQRRFALELLTTYAPPSSFSALAPAISAARQSKDVSLSMAALSLFSKVDPVNAAGELVALTDSGKLTNEQSIGLARAWGQIARSDVNIRPEAGAALSKILKSESRTVRAAAAEAYGFTGRSSQEELIKIVKTEFSDVAESAVFGLVNSVEVGAPMGRAVPGINEMWKRKGRFRRRAGQAFAKLAALKPGPVVSFLTKAAQTDDDPSLQAIGMSGLCNALRAGNSKSASQLAKAAAHSDIAVRQIAIECVLDYANNTKASALIAVALAADNDAQIRVESARVLATLAKMEGQPKSIGNSLSKLVKDSDSHVRTVAIGAIAHMSELPKASKKALFRAFGKGETPEKLEILRVAGKFGIPKLIRRGISDKSSKVRVAALDTAIASGSNVAATLSIALSDEDSSVRRAALGRLSSGKHGMSQSEVDEVLSLAIRDSDPSIADFAMLTSAKLGDPIQVGTRLKTALQDRSEVVRANAARASAGLVDQDPKGAITLLTPGLHDPSHDVRVALLAPLATAYAITLDQDGLRTLLTSSEKKASRRWVATGAFLIAGRQSEENRTKTLSTLESISQSGPPFAKEHALLALSLLKNSADGLEFLAVLVP